MGLGKVPFQRVDNRPLHRALVEQVVRRIVSGELRTGTVLPTEPVLSEQFGVSRTVVRDAVRILVSKGLLEVRQGSGMRVLPPDQWDYLDPHLIFEQIRSGQGEELLDEVLEVRRLLEVEVAGLAAERRTREQLSGLREVLEGLEQTITDPDEFTKLDIEFHDRILLAARNRLLREAMRQVVAVLNIGRLVTNRRAETRRDSMQGHTGIYESIEDGDAEAARETMRLHVQQFESDVRASLSSPESWDVESPWST